MSSGEKISRRRIEEFDGFDLRKIKTALKRPMSVALEEQDDEALYVCVWISELEANPDLKLNEVLKRTYGEIMEQFREISEMDPTSAGGGDPSPDSATSGE